MTLQAPINELTPGRKPADPCCAYRCDLITTHITQLVRGERRTKKGRGGCLQRQQYSISEQNRRIKYNIIYIRKCRRKERYIVLYRTDRLCVRRPISMATHSSNGRQLMYKLCKMASRRSYFFLPLLHLFLLVTNRHELCSKMCVR